MFLFRKSKSVKKRGSMPSNEVKAALEKFLSEDNTKLVRFLVRYWKDEQTVLTYKELRQAIIDKTVPLQMFRDWQQDYSKMVHEKLVPEWKKAMKAGAANQMKHKNLDIGFKFNPEHWAVKEWLQNHAAELVTASTTEQKNALGALIDMGIQSHMQADELARYIRPCIGLTKPQAVANKRYYDNLKEQLRKDHPRMSAESIEKKAHEAAIKYADKQMQQRAKTIALTEKAKAYEYGRFQHTQQLVEAGILPPQKKVWYTTRNENVCTKCRALHGKSVAMDEYFLDDASNPVFLPPLHPRCKCCIMYEDDKTQFLYSVPDIEIPADWNDKESVSDYIIKGYDNFVVNLRSDEEASFYKRMMSFYAESCELMEDVNSRTPFGYMKSKDIICFNPTHPNIQFYDMDYVYAHETTHRMDFLQYHSWENKEFLEAIDSCSKKVMDNWSEVESWFEIDGKYEYSFAISDIISALTKGEMNVPVGHDKNYYSNKFNQSAEIFANISSIDVLQLNERDSILKELFGAYKKVTGQE